MKLRVGGVLVSLFICAIAWSQPTQPAGQASREHRDKLIAQARQRMALDRKKYDPQQLKECEDLYQVANKNWRSDESRTVLKVMMEKYPDVNRTGCAALYLAQYERDPAEQERLLKDVIAKYGDCWYGNGAQVGALARLFRADDLWRAGDKEAAQKFFDEIAKDYPDAITHKGIALKDVIESIKTATADTPPAK